MRNVGYIPPYWWGWCLKFQGNPTFNFYISSRENKETERDTEGVGWDMSILQKLFIYWLFNASVSRNVRMNAISLVFRSRFHRQNITPLGPPLQAKFLNGSSNAIWRLPLCGRPENRLPFQNCYLKITLPNVTNPKA